MDLLHLNLPMDNKKGTIGSFPTQIQQAITGFIPEQSLNAYAEANTDYWRQANQDLIIANAYGLRVASYTLNKDGTTEKVNWITLTRERMESSRGYRLLIDEPDFRTVVNKDDYDFDRKQQGIDDQERTNTKHWCETVRTLMNIPFPQYTRSITTFSAPYKLLGHFFPGLQQLYLKRSPEFPLDKNFTFGLHELGTKEIKYEGDLPGLEENEARNVRRNGIALVIIYAMRREIEEWQKKGAPGRSPVDVLEMKHLWDLLYSTKKAQLTDKHVEDEYSISSIHPVHNGLRNSWYLTIFSALYNSPPAMALVLSLTPKNPRPPGFLDFFPGLQQLHPASFPNSLIKCFYFGLHWRPPPPPAPPPRHYRFSANEYLNEIQTGWGSLNPYYPRHYRNEIQRDWGSLESYL
ncbi:MAG: hypothetical protein Q9226_002730 [Calogaya cf. arnoldii]